MKRILIILMTNILVLYILSACAVQKRKYMPGYYFSGVTKTHPVQPIKTPVKHGLANNAKLETVQIIVVPADKNTVNNQLLAQADIEPKTTTHKKEKISHFPLTTKKFKPLADLKRVNNFHKVSTQAKPKVLATLGFILSILAIFLILAGVALLLFGAGPAVLLVGIATEALAFILCLIAIIKKLFKPLSRGTWMAILGIIISAATLYFGFLSI